MRIKLVGFRGIIALLIVSAIFVGNFMLVMGLAYLVGVKFPLGEAVIPLVFLWVGLNVAMLDNVRELLVKFTGQTEEEF